MRLLKNTEITEIKNEVQDLRERSGFELKRIFDYT